MKFLDEYISDFQDDGIRGELGEKLRSLQERYVAASGARALETLAELIELYNWLGMKSTKEQYDINSNLARNLPGTLMQDWLIHVVMGLTSAFPELYVLTEVKVPFGIYPTWKSGIVSEKSPAEKSDIAVGYLRCKEKRNIKMNTGEFCKKVFHQDDIVGYDVLPLITVNSKIRVSQSEFFDWQGREQLMTKGNPHCLSIQVALRKEMVMDVVEASQASEKFFLLGNGGERSTVPNNSELLRLIDTIQDHLDHHMLAESVYERESAARFNLEDAPVSTAQADLL